MLLKMIATIMFQLFVYQENAESIERQSIALRKGRLFIEEL